MNIRRRLTLRHTLATGRRTTVRRPAILVLLTLLPPGLLPAGAVADATPIYRSTASDGTVQFSDRATPQATLVTPRPLTVIPRRDEPEPLAMPDTPSPVETRPVASGSAAPGESPAPMPIERVGIVSPPPEATLLDPGGPLLVEIGTSPGSLPGSGLRAEVLMDGRMVASGRTSALAVPVPERGAHELQVRLVAGDGRVHRRSEKQTLHVRRSLTRDARVPRFPGPAERTDEER